METLGVTQSVCPVCRNLVPARIITDGRDVYFRKFCPAHGESACFVRSDVDDWLSSQRFVKPAWVPKSFSGKSDVPCPQGCGVCQRHEQHLCMPIVEITTRCDLACPICIADAGAAWDMTPAEFKRLLDLLIQAEQQIDIINISGGEPLVHPKLLQLVGEAVSRPEIVRVSISTNGLQLLRRPDLLKRLHDMGVCISLQFDGFSDRAYEMLRGRPLLEEKLALLEMLRKEGISTSLTMTAARGVNEGEFRPMLDYLFANEHAVSMMIQPIAFAGRAERADREWRLTIPDVVRALGEAGHPSVSASDFAPLPCSHAHCFSLAFYLVLKGGGAVSINRIVPANDILDAVANHVFYGLSVEEHLRLKEMVYELWSGPSASAPDSEAVLRTVQELLRRVSCCYFDPKKVFSIAERQMKSIFIHAFQDADTFDLARARRCCNAYPQADGRFMPACTFNVIHRRRPSGLAGSG